MSLPFWLQEGLQRSCDWLYAYLPQAVPDMQQVEKCKIISHRGEHDNKHVYENTLPAFECLLEQEIWGIELDIRWTQDLVPVVFHDADCKRLFHSNIRINEITSANLKATFPQIPLLEEVIQRFGKKLHLMVEAKTETYPDPEYQGNVLQNLFADLESRTDYHFISLDPEMFQFIQFVDNDAFLPVAEMNERQMSRISLQRDYGGVTGHYLLLTDAIVAEQHRQGKQVGTGFISSKNCLCREINRGVEWIFTNNALELKAIQMSLLAELKSR